jgi:intracellular sulfur oxidation DsrE/DsrF family protein
MRRGLLWTVACMPLLVGYISVAGSSQDKPAGSELRIDIPVRLERGDLVFNMNHFVMRGDMPVGIRYMDLLSRDFKEKGTKGRIIGVFYNDAGHFTLDDRAYNAARKVKTGNPYKTLILELIEQGVQIEECAVTMRANGWTNDDLIPGVKVNSGAIQRILELEQQGFVQIQP